MSHERPADPARRATEHGMRAEVPPNAEARLNGRGTLQAGRGRGALANARIPNALVDATHVARGRQVGARERKRDLASPPVPGAPGRHAHARAPRPNSNCNNSAWSSRRPRATRPGGSTFAQHGASAAPRAVALPAASIHLQPAPSRAREGPRAWSVRPAFACWEAQSEGSAHAACPTSMRMQEFGTRVVSTLKA